MKTFKISFLVFAVFAAMTFISCGGEKAAGNGDDNNTDSTETTSDADAENTDDADNTADAGENADYAKLSDEAKTAISENFKAQCPCITENKEELNSMVEKIKPMVEKMQSGEMKPEEAMGSMMGVMAGMQGYGECVQKAGITEDGMKSVEKEVEEMFADLSEEEKVEKQMAIIKYAVDKECPDGTEFLTSMMELGQEMEKMKK